MPTVFLSRENKFSRVGPRAKDVFVVEEVESEAEGGGPLLSLPLPPLLLAVPIAGAFSSSGSPVMALKAVKPLPPVLLHVA